MGLFANEARFSQIRCTSGHVLSKTKSVTPQFFHISDISNSSTFTGKIFRKKSMLEKFRANVLKALANEDTLLLMMFFERANTRDAKLMSCFHAAQTRKHLLGAQNVSEQNQKHFLCPRHKICFRNKFCARGETGKHLCRQQCVRNNVSSFARAFREDLVIIF